MNKVSSFLIFFVGMLAINAYAQGEIFRCSSSNGKVISLYQSGDVLTCKFGQSSSKKYIEIKRKLKELNITIEIPQGTGLDSSVEFKNGIYSYTVNESLNRVNEAHKSTVWLDMKKNGEIISSIDCGLDSGSLSNIDTSYK